MAEYIEREAAFNAIFNIAPKVDDDGYCWVIRGDAARAIDSIPAADVRPVKRGKWEKVGEQMLINLENAREQYAALGYPHRKILILRCSSCRKVTMVDSSIAYDFCPHCGADMREES